jgi:hypothetical protein
MPVCCHFRIWLPISGQYAHRAALPGTGGMREDPAARRFWGSVAGFGQQCYAGSVWGAAVMASTAAVMT